MGDAFSPAFTVQLVEEVKGVLAHRDDIEYCDIRLADLNLPFCRGCYICFYKGEDHCPFQAVVQPILHALAEADCLIITSPVYSMHVTGLIKNFLDLTSYHFHRPRFFDKKALVVCSTQGGGVRQAGEFLRGILMHWGFDKVYTLSATRRGAAEPSPKHKAHCQRVGQRFFDDVFSGRLHKPSLKRLFYQQVWRASSLSTGAPTADYIYWQESGLAQSAYDTRHTLGVFKKLYSGVIFALMRNTFK